jgi:hypothetical protein
MGLNKIAERLAGERFANINPEQAEPPIHVPVERLKQSPATPS